MPEAGPNARTSELEALLDSKEPAEVLNVILSSTPSGAIIARAPDGKVVRVNDFVARLSGRPRSDLEGRFVSEAEELMPAYDASGGLVPPDERAVARALRGETVIGFEQWLDTADGQRIPVATSAAPIRNWRGNVIGAITAIADLRPYKDLERSLRDALAERETQWQELTHRVKNHLQIMSAMVAKEARIGTSTEEFAELMKGRLQTLGAVYRSLDRAEVGACVEIRTFFEDVCRPYVSDAVSVEAVVTPPDLTLTPEQAGPVGMLVNEAVCNCRKYAFPDRGGHIHVSLRRLEPGRLRLEIVDDGVGWPHAREGHRATHGLDLMRMFAKQLDGELELRDRLQGGAMVAAEIPEAATECARAIRR